MSVFDAVLDEADYPREQITSLLRQAIQSGQLMPGERLPSTETLAENWKTHVPTVHAAMTGLVREGLLVRLHGRGTFVREKSEKLTRVAIYHTHHHAERHQSRFIYSLQRELLRTLQAMGIEGEITVDPRSGKDAEKPWAELLAAARNKQFQGIIVTSSRPALRRWLGKLPVPQVYFSSDEGNEVVDFDHQQFLEISLRELVRQGCRSAGLIFPGTPNNNNGRWNQSGQFVENFKKLCADLGLQVRKSWIQVEKVARQACDDSQEDFGNGAFHRLWNYATKPDGLVVYPDTSVRGVVLALAQHGVRVPQDLRLVFHRNAGVPVLCPFPASWIVSSEAEIATALIEQIKRQTDGQQCRRLSLKYHLESSGGRKSGRDSRG